MERVSEINAHTYRERDTQRERGRQREADRDMETIRKVEKQGVDQRRKRKTEIIVL